MGGAALCYQEGEGGGSLENISFYVEPGEVLGIVGKNGAGKSTLLKSIVGLQEIQQGYVIIGGHILGRENQAIREQVGFVSFDMVEKLSGKLYQVAKYLGSYYKNFSMEQFLEYGKAFQLKEKSKLEKMSTGEKILFSLAFSLSCKPRVLMMDEPFSNLDPITREDVLDILRGVLEEGNTSLLYATHLMEELEQLADRVLFLENGRQKLFADVNEIQDTYFAGRQMHLEELYVLLESLCI